MVKVGHVHLCQVAGNTCHVGLEQYEKATWYPVPNNIGSCRYQYPIPIPILDKSSASSNVATLSGLDMGSEVQCVNPMNIGIRVLWSAIPCTHPPFHVQCPFNLSIASQTISMHVCMCACGGLQTLCTPGIKTVMVTVTYDPPYSGSSTWGVRLHHAAHIPP